MNPWDLLGISPTADRRAIKRAYATLSKRFHPEEEPERFQALYAAYQEALRRSTDAPFGAKRDIDPKINKDNPSFLKSKWSRMTRRFSSCSPALSLPRRTAPPAAPGREAAFDFESALAGHDARQAQRRRQYMEQGIMRSIHKLLFSPKQRGGKKPWRELFLTDAFLSAQYDPVFLDCLPAFLKEQRELPMYELPPALCTELIIAYSVLHPSDQPYAPREGTAPLYELLQRQRDSRYHNELKKSDTERRRDCFFMYNRLLSLCDDRRLLPENDDWKDLLKLAQHASKNLKRHPDAFVLLGYLVRSRPSLPRDFLTYAYELFDMEHFETSSTKVAYRPLYLALRERGVGE